MGRAGRDALTSQMPGLRRAHQIDFVVANAENATQGRGITMAHARQLLAAGIDCLTLGDHAFDQRGLVSEIETDPRILRPLNFAKSAPGKGARLFTDARGRKTLVVSVLGRVFMNAQYDDPFQLVRNALDTSRLGSGAAASIVDFHAEATSEKNAMGLFCDGSASLVAGTHTHIPTADHRILKNGTAYVTDIGMSGAYDSVIGIEQSEPLRRFVSGMRLGKFVAAAGEVTISGVIVETDDATGLAVSIKPFRLGGSLEQRPA